MELIDSHKIKMINRKDQEKAIGDFALLRGKHLDNLNPIEEKIRELAPLPASYDISRVQPPYFSEFTYTEMLGGMILSPQSAEIGTRLIQQALNSQENPTFNILNEICNKRDNLDKYNLNQKQSKQNVKKVIYTPGSNILVNCLSRDIVSKIMFRDEEVFIKPHPLINQETIRELGLAFGYHRIIDPNESGTAYLNQAEKIYVTSATEIGLYAVLKEISIDDVTSFHFESRCAYSHIYQFLWGLPVKEAKETLLKILSSSYSGFFHPSDPEWVEKLKKYYQYSMQLRDFFKPLMPELTIGEYATAICSRGIPKIEVKHQKIEEKILPND